MIVAVFAIPQLIRGFGTDRFGVFMITWALIGYFGLFDMGLGRALTLLVANRLGSDADEDVPGIVSTTLTLLWALGLIGMVVVWFLSPWIAESVLAMPRALHEEARDAFRVLALSLPFVLATAGLRGALEAHQRFGAISLMRVVLGVMTFVGPLLVLPFDGGLQAAVVVLVVVRVLVWWGHRQALRRVVQVQAKTTMWEKRWLRPLFAFGGWLTVTNIVGPLMTYLDRLVIGSILSVAAVAYYTTPYEVVTRVTVVPAAISGVLFPAFAAHWSNAPEKTVKLAERGAMYTMIALFPVLLLVAMFARELLMLWLGAEFAEQGTPVLQWLSAGVLINGVALIFLALIQGVGRSDWTAKLHLAELLPYLLVLWLLLSRNGIVGAAMAWFLRVTVDALALMLMATRLDAAVFKGALRHVVWCSVIGTGVILSAMFVYALELRLLLFLGVIAAFLLLAWQRMLGAVERDLVRHTLARKTG